MLVVAAAAAQGSRLYTRPALPPAEMLERLNLTLAWHSRVAVDGLRDGLFSLQLVPGKNSFQFIVQTRQGAIVAVDAETGDLLWQTQVGQPYWSGQPVAFNSQALFVTRRDQLYALDRNTGRHLFETLDPRSKQRIVGVPLTGVPSAAAVADERMLYIPFGSRVSALQLPFERTKAPSVTLEEKYARTSATDEPLINWDAPLSGLRIEQPLLLTNPPRPAASALGAVSPEGTFFSLSSQERSEPIVFKTGAAVAVPLGQYENIAYLATENGNLYALNIANTDQLWRFNAEAPLFRKPDVTARDVYLSPDRLGLFRVDRKTGVARWLNRDGVHFLAVNNDFVYATDRLGRFLVLDYFRGTTLAVYDLRDYPVLFHNELTDRIYLGSNDGLILCLRHRGQRTPLLNKLPPPPPPKAKEMPKQKKTEPEEGASERGVLTPWCQRNQGVNTPCSPAYSARSCKS